MLKNACSFPPILNVLFLVKYPGVNTEGLNGICTHIKYVNNRKLLVARSVVTVPKNRMIPVKMLNPTDKNHHYSQK